MECRRRLLTSPACRVAPGRRRWPLGSVGRLRWRRRPGLRGGRTVGVRLRPAGDRLRSGRPEGRHRCGQAGQAGVCGRAAQHDGRGLRQHRHHPVQDAARGRALPDRVRPAGHVRRQLPGQVRDHHRRPAGPHRARGRPGDRGDPQPADAQPRRHPRRHRPLRGRAHHRRARRGPRRQRHGDRGEHRDRHRDPPGPSARGRVRRRSRDRLRRGAQAAPGARVAGRGRGRGDRDRVRLDVRRARHPGHRGREAAGRCSSSATPRWSSRSSSTCATRP